MPIKITRQGDQYIAEITPLHGGNRYWKSPYPMGIEELTQALQGRDCHQTDIGDAFYEADPE